MTFKLSHALLGITLGMVAACKKSTVKPEVAENRDTLTYYARGTAGFSAQIGTPRVFIARPKGYPYNSSPNPFGAVLAPTTWDSGDLALSVGGGMHTKVVVDFVKDAAYLSRMDNKPVGRAVSVVEGQKDTLKFPVKVIKVVSGSNVKPFLQNLNNIIPGNTIQATLQGGLLSSSFITLDSDKRRTQLFINKIN